MAQIEMQTTATNAVRKTNLPRHFVARLIVSSILSAAGLLSFALTGPIVCRIAAIDPALEAFNLSLVAGWFWSLAWMWSLTGRSGGVGSSEACLIACSNFFFVSLITYLCR